MTATTLVVIGAVVTTGVTVGLTTAQRLRTLGYRLDDEVGPLRQVWWWPTVALPLVWVWSTWHIGEAADGAVLPAYLLLGWVTVALSWVDLDVHRLPDGLVYPAYPALAVLLVIASLADPDRTHLWAVWGGVGLVVAFGSVALLVPSWMGLGDVKVAGMVGMTLGWWGPATLLLGVMVSFILGGLHALVALMAMRGGRNSEIAYGPSLLLGAVLVSGTGFQIVTAAAGR